MKSIFEKIFLKSPIFIQNIALSIYGLKTQHIRYGGAYCYYYDKVSSHLNYSEADLASYIEEELKKTVVNAVKNVPYYKNLFDKENIPSDVIKSIKDIKKIPFLDKEQIRLAPNDFVNQTFNINKLLIIHTTGTTGTPLYIYCNNETRQNNYAYYNRFLNNIGINFQNRRATFGGRIIVPTTQNFAPFWRYSFFQKNLLFSSYHLTDENIPFYIEKLKTFKPDYIDAYPSSLFCIAQYANANNIDLKGITKGITTSAETLYPEQRHLIESVFNVPIYDQYGAAEMCVFVGQCREGKYHIHTDYGLIEFLREDGSNAAPGEEAEIVCTSFINPVMPLIRYRIGDRGVLSSKPCKCGCIFPVMDKLLGRIDDVIITPDGRHVGRLSPVMKGFPVKEIQFIQTKPEEVDVHVVKAAGYNESTEIDLIYQLRNRLGATIALNIKYVDQIKRGKGAKLKSIISLINNNN